MTFFASVLLTSVVGFPVVDVLNIWVFFFNILAYFPIKAKLSTPKGEGAKPYVGNAVVLFNRFVYIVVPNN